MPPWPTAASPATRGSSPRHPLIGFCARTTPAEPLARPTSPATPARTTPASATTRATNARCSWSRTASASLAMARPATPARLTPAPVASRATTSRCSWTRTAAAGFPLVAWPTSSRTTRPSTLPGWARPTPTTAASRADTDTVRHSSTRTAPAAFPVAWRLPPRTRRRLRLTWMSVLRRQRRKQQPVVVAVAATLPQPWWGLSPPHLPSPWSPPAMSARRWHLGSSSSCSPDSRWLSPAFAVREVIMVNRPHVTVWSRQLRLVSVAKRLNNLGGNDRCQRGDRWMF